MDHNHAHNRSDLRDIARQAMTERDLWPDFSTEIQRELAAMPGPAPPAAPGVKDLRELLWCSIDNDDSLDLDQLTVSEALPGGAVRILVAIADVDALVG
ncbi:MAG TPA: RNB domain-containing ribonuclease, partial [Thermoanaerobaculia bacterium]|nr:RNB domain-containing ribonuclease [Thermoanaerobaculia bacterium]